MRRNHIEYFKELVNEIKLFDKNKNDFIYPFKDKLLEIYPSEQDIIESFPCAVLVFKNTVNNLDSRLKEKNRIEPVFRDNKKYNQYLVRHFKQEFNYQLHFWVNDPSYEIFSDSENYGIIDQALLFISKNSKKTYKAVNLKIKEIEFQIDVGNSEMEAGNVSNKSVYQFILNIIIKDGLYEILQEETLYNAKFKIEPPIEINSI